MGNSEFLSDKARVRKQQAEAKRGTKQKKNHAPLERMFKEKIMPQDLVRERVEFVHTAENYDEKSAAWMALHLSATLRETSNRFRYPDPKQKAVAAGSFELHNVKESVLRRIESELSPEWHRVKAVAEPQVQAEESAA